jgi:hypothetical protein
MATDGSGEYWPPGEELRKKTLIDFRMTFKKNFYKKHATAKTYPIIFHGLKERMDIFLSGF